MFKLTSLNLNGIRSATSKGVEAWIAQSRPDCICVQEIKAQSADMQGRFEELAGLKGFTRQPVVEAEQLLDPDGWMARKGPGQD